MSALHRRNLLAGLTGLAAFCGGDAWANAPAPKTVRKPAPLPRPKLVFLDPGHGGRDPGALGLRGTQEKSVVMAIARDLQKELLAGGRYRVLLTRSTDSFVALRERVARAQAAKADCSCRCMPTRTTTPMSAAPRSTRCRKRRQTARQRLSPHARTAPMQ